MHEYAVFLAGLDAFLLDFNEDSVRSSAMESGTPGVRCVMENILEEGPIDCTTRPALGDKTSEFLNGHRRRPTKHSFTSTPSRRGAHVPRSRSTHRPRPPSLLMKPLPIIPTLSSPILPDDLLRPGTPSSVEPDLIWGTSAASNSVPGSLATPGRAYFPTSPVSPFSEIDTAEILRIYDELRPSTPVQSDILSSTSISGVTADSEPCPLTPPATRKTMLDQTSRTMARNHPYIPWSASVRRHALPPSPAQSWVSPTVDEHRPSRPPSRSGAMAPEPEEPEEDFIQPGCWRSVSPKRRWGALAGTVKKKVARTLRFGHRRPHPEQPPSIQHVDVPSGSEDPATPPREYVLPPIDSITPQVRGLRAPFRPSPTPSPHTLAPVPPAHLPFMDSPVTPSPSSCCGDGSLEAWLESRRRLSRELSLRTGENLTMEEYERRGSWLYAGLEGCVIMEDDEGGLDERHRRAGAMYEGWACGFAGCTMHPRGQPPPLPPKRSRRRRPAPLERTLSDPSTEVTCGH